jgi:hypothetical protein
LPFTPLAAWLGVHSSLPAWFFPFLIAVVAYLALVEMLKRRLMERRLT